MNSHFDDCPTQNGYNCCTCDMSGEELAAIEWQIKKQESGLKWWDIVGRLTLFFFGPGHINSLSQTTENLSRLSGKENINEANE